MATTNFPNGPFFESHPTGATISLSKHCCDASKTVSETTICCICKENLPSRAPVVKHNNCQAVACISCFRMWFSEQLSRGPHPYECYYCSTPISAPFPHLLARHLHHYDLEELCTSVGPAIFYKKPLTERTNGQLLSTADMVKKCSFGDTEHALELWESFAPLQFMLWKFYSFPESAGYVRVVGVNPNSVVVDALKKQVQELEERKKEEKRNLGRFRRAWRVVSGR